MISQSIPTINHFVALLKVDPFENSTQRIESAAESVISDLDLNVVKKFTHTFSPQGETLIYVISESHLIIHTWPELGTIHVDLVTCSPRSQKEVESTLKYSFTEFNPNSIEIKTIEFDKL